MAESGSAPRVFMNVDGSVLPAIEAKISPLDHGFLYGDTVYETVRIFARAPFLLGRHLDRLERSLARVFLPLPLSRGDIEAEVRRTIDGVPFDDAVLRITVTRGVGPIGLDMSLCREPRLLIYATELLPSSVPAHASPRGPDGGIAVVIASLRRISPNALDPAIKSGNFLNNVLAFREARLAGAQEAILLGQEGFIAEGTTSNVFLVRGGRLGTPRPEGILDGVTRAVVIEEARAASIPIEERDFLPHELAGADEAFITSSVRGVLPIATVDGRPIGLGRRGPLTRRLQELYEARVEKELALAASQAKRSG